VKGRKGIFHQYSERVMIEDTTAYREMMRMNREDFEKVLKAIAPDVSPRQVMGDGCSPKVDTNYTIPCNRRNLPLNFQFRISRAAI